MTTAPHRDGQAGITLVEMLVALAIFALVGLASFTTLETILRVQDRTEGRLETIAQLDRALLVFSHDIAEADPEGVTLRDGALIVRMTGGARPRGYRRTGRALIRDVAAPAASTVPDIAQTVLAPVAAVAFRVLAPGDTWHDTWPDEDTPPLARAIEMTLTLEGDRAVRRLVPLVQVVSQ